MTARAVFALRIVALIIGAAVTLAGLAAVRADSHPPIQRPIIVQFRPVPAGSLS